MSGEGAGQLRPWDRQPGESRQAYEAFSAYRAMPTKARSLRVLSQAIGKDKALLGRWSSRHAWQARVLAFDADQQRAADDAVKDDLRAQAITIRREQGTVQQQQLLAARALMREALRAIQTEQQKAAPDPRNLQLAGQALTAAIQQQRLATGLPTDVTRQDVQLRENVQEALKLTDQVRMIIGEHLCDDCRARVTEELRRLSARQQQIADSLG